MYRILLAGFASVLVAACAWDPALASHVSPAPLTGEYLLGHSNVAEFDGRVTIHVTAEVVGERTRFVVEPVGAWPVLNGFLGFDKFFYNEDADVVRVQDEGCDQEVVDGEACGWRVNYNGCTGDGFGCFLSRTNADSASHGATTMPLVFWVAPRVELNPNDHGATMALHGRFDDAGGLSNGCSGWFSDGLSGAPASDPGCLPRPAPTCELLVQPAERTLLRGDTVHVTLAVSTTGLPSGIPALLAVLTSPLPAGFTVMFTPNPVLVPGTGDVAVAAGVGAAPGGYELMFGAFIQVSDTEVVSCRAPLVVDIPVVTPPGACGCE